ncbi:MAG TPA: amidase [Hyphomicrobiales bacterium]|nr:amidase [Hyphomicrobiales bacterium]
MTADLADLTAAELAPKLASGEVRARELTEACLKRISERESEVEAWTYLDPEYARAQAKSLDEHREAGRPIGPLHGLPVGLKDIIDTADMPTENGTVLHRGRQPREDATVTALLRQAGALILGKAVATECAVMHPGKTKNPHDPGRTPGGSSSGSAAAVAAGMVPLSLGTQTNGSMIRPASFCGVFGMKPTYGLIPRTGVLAQSRFLDTLGVYGRSVADLALIGEVLMRPDPRDPDTRPRPAPPLGALAAEKPPVKPMLAFVKTPVWDKADDDAREAFGELASALGSQCDEVELPEVFTGAWEWHRKVMFADIAKSFAGLYDRGRDQLSEILRGIIEEGREVLAVDYAAAKDWRPVLNAGLNEIFERYDAILTPATTGEAPVGLEATGDPTFCTLWTFCGTPAVSLPLLVGANGMPIGVQLVGPVGDDARLLRTAAWLVDELAEQA